MDEGNGKNTVLLLSHAAVSTSGSARQMAKIGGAEYSHVLDPRTGLGMTEGRQVSVQAPSAALADALATAGNVMREEDFRSLAARLPGVSVPAFFRSSSRFAEGTQEQDGARRPR
ncbi:FAD:protein FMN transferase [Akkermansia sp.]|uniref:FAD:protein FMN transferase n=1 Tax=Akkermansia sp. TaxID=1872421 RepID=UPI003AB3BF29